ncbi:glycosyltransferase [Nocardia niigatensis]|uniref:glycosyltransferase n=1 Tax=Nocardia niigatensis TaxID=209249 RepID=UPI0002FEC124|nr:nucleotide disphospho-sugar-binding domain-containing protein [Nocardia niigatensis]
MKVLLAFAGSRGDAQPGVLLGRELTGRGHAVTLAVSPNLVGFAERHGVSAVPCGLDSDESLRAQRDDRRFRHPNPVQRVRAVLDLQRRGFAEAARDLLALAGDNEVLVTGMACEEVAAEAAGRHGLPLAAMHFFPIRPNRSVAVLPTAQGGRLPGPVNRLGWKALTAARAWALAPQIAALRAEFAGPATPRLPGVPAYTAIQAYDPALFPGLAEDLGAVPFTGFPVVTERGAGISEELGEWLISGAAPVYAGFGSMPVTDPVATEAMVREACRRLGLRMLLVGPQFRGRIAGELAVVDQVDHRAVLPLCAAAVHHGGAGTTAAVLRAGVPSVICSVQADQPYWGRQVESLGLGATAPFTGLNANRLERLLIRATEPSVVLRAAAHGARFRDNGVQSAADVIESLAPEPESFPAGALDSVSTMIGGVR